MHTRDLGSKLEGNILRYCVLIEESEPSPLHLARRHLLHRNLTFLGLETKYVGSNSRYSLHCACECVCVLQAPHCLELITWVLRNIGNEEWEDYSEPLVLPQELNCSLDLHTAIIWF